MKVIIFDGTAEEFNEVAQSLSDATTASDISKGDMASGKDEVVEPKEAIRKMLKRISISNGQRAVYRALSEGEMKYEDLLKKIGKTSGELAGVLGALGRRINNTKEIHQAGVPGSVTAVLHYRKENDELYLSLTKDAEQVLKEEGVI